MIVLSKNILRLIITIGFVPVMVYLFIRSHHHDVLDIFPLSDDLTITTYTDDEDPLKRGNSVILSFAVDSTIRLSTQINDAINYPYAGFRIKPPAAAPFVDIRPFDKIEITIDSTNATFFILDLTTYIDGYSHFNDYMSFRHHTAEIFTKTGPQTITLATKEIETQGWWFSLRKLNPEKLGKPDFSKCHTFSFEINSTVKTAIPYYVTVSAIKLIDTHRYSFFSAILLLLLYSTLFMLTFLPPKRGHRPIAIKQTDLANAIDTELLRIEAAVAENYQDPDCSLTKIARIAGVGIDKVSTSLTKFHNRQFKQYLNTVRITEAQRLLKETDRNISEIALAVGYNYPTTFNRVFKEITGLSPTTFRKPS